MSVRRDVWAPLAGEEGSRVAGTVATLLVRGEF